MAGKLKLRNHVIVILTALGICLAAVAAIELFCGDMIENTKPSNPWLSFTPLYNEFGSMYHQQLGIGYLRWVLLLENVSALIFMLCFYRSIVFFNSMLGIESLWLYFLDLGLAATFCRVLERLLGRYTLDYLRIGITCYDLQDFFIGISIVGMIFWFIRMEIKYLSLRKRATKNMSRSEKFRWSLRFSLLFLQTLVLPADKISVGFLRPEDREAQTQAKG